MQCDRCAGDEFTKAGRDRQGRQRYRCTRCGRRLTPRSMSVFSGYRFPDEVSALAVLYCAKIPSVGFHSSATTFGLIGTGRSFRTVHECSFSYSWEFRCSQELRQPRHVCVAIGASWCKLAQVWLVPSPSGRALLRALAVRLLPSWWRCFFFGIVTRHALSWLLVSSGSISHTHNTSSQDSYEAPFFNCP